MIDPIFFAIGLIIGMIGALVFIELIKILKWKLKVYLFRRFEEKERRR